MSPEDPDLKIMGWIFGVGFFLAFIWFLVVAGNNIDENTLGEYMCSQHNLSFVSTESYGMDFTSGGKFNSNIEDMKLKITCKEPEPEQQIDDGYLVVVR